MEASVTSLNSDEQVVLDSQLKMAMDDRDKIVKKISEYIKNFIDDRDEAVKTGLIPSFEEVGYLYARIEDEKSLFSLLQGYNHSNNAVIDFNKAGELTTSDSEKKSLYQSAANSFKSAGESFTDSASKCNDFLKVDMGGLKATFDSVGQKIENSAKKLFEKAEEAQQLANNC